MACFLPCIIIMSSVSISFYIIKIIEKQLSNVLVELFNDINYAYKPDIVLIDSRTGVVDMAGSLLFNYSDAVCAFFYNNEQNKQGLKVLIDCVNERNNKGLYVPDFNFIHSPIRYSPSSLADRGFHDDFISYLEEIL